MRTNQAQLEFAVDLAQLKSDISPRELRIYRRDLEMFLRNDHAVSGVTVTAKLSEAAPLPEDYSVQDFEVLRKDAYAVLKDIVKGKYAKIHSPEEFNIMLKFSAAPIKQRSSAVFAYGSTRDAFLCKLFLLLGQEPTDRILRCKATDCEKIFYRQRNQEFCSKRCSSRTYMRELREVRPDYRESEKEAAHARYIKRIKKINPKRKVERRRRKTI